MLKIIVARDIKGNLVVLNIKPYNDNPTDEDKHEVSAAYELLNEAPSFNDSVELISELTKEPKELFFIFEEAWDYEHEDCDVWLKEIKT